jgi:Domain of unknown function (DUF4062)
MGARKEVFISATSADLGSYRQVAKEAVLTLGAHPIEEKNLPTDYRELQALLARRLDPCDAIVHLVGFHYGGEPKSSRDTPRRSWTQWEYYRATQGVHHKPVYGFLARENCHFDAQPTEDAEKQRLQCEHREHLKTPGGPIYYEFSTPEELRVLILSIDELRELVRPRRVRIPFLPMREKFTGRRQFLKTLQQDLTAGTALVVAQPISVYADGASARPRWQSNWAGGFSKRGNSTSFFFSMRQHPNRSMRSWRPFARQMLWIYRSRLPQSRRLVVPA